MCDLKLSQCMNVIKSSKVVSYVSVESVLMTLMMETKKVSKLLVFKLSIDASNHLGGFCKIYACWLFRKYL
jgi:hypothetical protein